MNDTNTIGVPAAMITTEPAALKNSMVSVLKDIKSVISVTSMSFENLLRIRPKDKIIYEYQIY